MLGAAAALVCLAAALLLACLWQLEGVRPLEWLTVPLSLLYANLAEYVGHRWPMHRPFRGLGLVYKRHAGQHHRFFTHEAMPVESGRDFRALLFPPVLVLFFFGLFGVPVWFALAWLLSFGVGERKWLVFGLSAGLTALVSVLLMLQPDFGSTIIFIASTPTFFSAPSA